MKLLTLLLFVCVLLGCGRSSDVKILGQWVFEHPELEESIDYIIYEFTKEKQVFVYHYKDDEVIGKVHQIRYEFLASNKIRLYDEGLYDILRIKFIGDDAIESESVEANVPKKIGEKNIIKRRRNPTR